MPHVLLSPFKLCFQPGTPREWKNAHLLSTIWLSIFYIVLAHTICTASLSCSNSQYWWGPKAYRGEGPCPDSYRKWVSEPGFQPSFVYPTIYISFTGKWGWYYTQRHGLSCGLVGMPAQGLVYYRCLIHANSPSLSLPPPLLHPREMYDLPKGKSSPWIGK